jgi:mannose-1-phosphate guanylyltransferase
LDQVWPGLPNISIDHGIMEHADRVAVVPLDAGWSDVGSWDALAAILPHDDQQNVIAGGDIATLDSSGNIVYAAQEKIVALIGVNDLVVVDTGDAILVGTKDQMQAVKQLVDQLEQTGRKRFL